jgi:heptaprenyl diphosphate synthase
MDGRRLPARCACLTPTGSAPPGTAKRRPFWGAFPAVARELEGVRGLILETAASGDDEIHAAIRRLVESNGKMLRPAFVLLAARFGSAEPARMARLGAAIELMHMATLVHDDLIDGAALRRGVPTLHTRLGPRTAVLAGDTLFATCFSLVADHAEAATARSLARMVTLVCDGEIAETADRFLASTSVRRYLRRIAEKTALLFSLAFQVGARESGVAEPVAAALRRLGWCLGMAFQVVDDILDFDAGNSEIGKPVASDLRQGIFTLPVVLALRADEGTLGRALADRRYVSRRTGRARREIARIDALIRARGGLDGARAWARRYTERAHREIARLPAGEPRDVLAGVTDRLLDRTY